jgi:hypothetical protein
MQFRKKCAMYRESEFNLYTYYLNEELPVVGAVAEDNGRAGRSCRGMAKESSLAVVVVVTSKLRLALDEDPCTKLVKLFLFSHQYYDLIKQFQHCFRVTIPNIFAVCMQLGLYSNLHRSSYWFSCLYKASLSKHASSGTTF